MDSRALLETVAETYRNLQSLAVELLITTESDDDGNFSHNDQRARAFFVAPDKARVEQGGRRGSVTVANGADLHHYFGGPKRYMKSVVDGRDALPGWFRPEFPLTSGTTFLFSRIAERIAEAKTLRQELLPAEGSDELCEVLSVTYEPSHAPDFTMHTSPLTFWINSRTHLISKLQGEITHRLPAHDETHTNKQTVAFTRVTLNEPIPPETFEYHPPADAIDTSQPHGRSGCIVATGGGGGGTSYDRGTGRSLETWNSHDWAGNTLIERSKLKLNGLDLAFERRLTLSDDRRELRIVERMTGPKGETTREFSIPIA